MANALNSRLMSNIQNLLVVGDIHGRPETFVGPLGRFAHRILQLADLSGRPDLRGDELHNYLFGGDGMREAVRSLCEESRACLGIGFSAGGTALWHAAKAGLALHALICVSSTRLRFETSPINIPTFVLWGECDPNRPDDAWNDIVPTCWKTYPVKQHDFYCADILRPDTQMRKDIAAFIQRHLSL